MQDIEALENLPKRGKHLKTWDEQDRHRTNRDRVFYGIVSRWLDSQVGKNVDTVYSDWHRADWVPVKFKTIAQFGYWVELNTFVQNEIIYHFIGYNCVDPTKNFEPVTEAAWRNRTFYYVDPTTKLIQRVLHKRPEWKNRHKKTQNSNLVVLGNYHQLNKINGIWYESKAEVLTDIKWTDSICKNPFDNLATGTDSWDAPKVKIYRRQLNSKELRKHNLKNN